MAKIFYVSVLIFHNTFTQSHGKWFNLSFYYYYTERVLESQRYSIYTYILIILQIQTRFLVAYLAIHLTSLLL